MQIKPANNYSYLLVCKIGCTQNPLFFLTSEEKDLHHRTMFKPSFSLKNEKAQIHWNLKFKKCLQISIAANMNGFNVKVCCIFKLFATPPVCKGL